EVPPLVFVDCKTFGLHQCAKKVTGLSLGSSAACVCGMCALAEVVVSARHGHFTATREVEQRKVDGAAAIVPRTRERIGKIRAVHRIAVPEHPRNRPRTIRIEDEQSVPGVMRA